MEKKEKKRKKPMLFLLVASHNFHIWETPVFVVISTCLEL